MKPARRAHRGNSLAPYIAILGVMSVLGLGFLAAGCFRSGGFGGYWSRIDLIDKIFYGISALVGLLFAGWFGVIIARKTWRVLFPSR